MDKRWILRLLLLMFTMALLGACQSGPGSEAKKESEEKVLATIGDEVISLKRFQELYENLPPEYLFKYQGESGKKTLLGQMVELKMFAQSAQQLGLDKDPEIQRRIKEAREKILATAFHIKEVTEKVTVSDEEIREYYELHKKEHIRPEQVKVREIIVTNPKEAEEIIKLIKGGRASFQSLARERSVDTKRGASGGDLGWQQRGKGVMAKPVEDAAFSLKKGEIGGPIKTQYGYHIIKVEDRRETYQRPLEEAYQPIKNKIRNIKQRELMAQLKKKVKQDIKPEINWDLLKQIPVRQIEEPVISPGFRGSSRFPSAP
ncbi:MAG: peptidyl-prolyl cis-trans isomerase [Deltaproteobacteria bacterium]|nr:peptidyl-prolyl cis-trans isomerase [Deltaproteobacteria bacterium]